MEKEYKNIIFDLGNVLVKLDTDGCMKAFGALGLGQFLDSKTHPESHELMHSLCLGLISTEEFCENTRKLSGLPLSDEQIKDAANKMLVDIPDRRRRYSCSCEAVERRSTCSVIPLTYTGTIASASCSLTKAMALMTISIWSFSPSACTWKSPVRRYTVR